LRVDPDQLARLAPLDADKDEVLLYGDGDPVRVLADLDPADVLVRRHVDDRNVVAGAVGDVQLLLYLGRVRGRQHAQTAHGNNQGKAAIAHGKTPREGLQVGSARGSFEPLA